MKRGTAAKVILGKDTLMDVPAGIVHGTDVILGGKAGLLNDFGGLVLSNNLMIGKKVSRGTITTVTVRGQSPLVLPDAIAGSLQAVKAFGGTEQRNLPDGYIERQFIYMMDNSYLLPSITPEPDWHIEMDFQTTSVSTAGARNYFGSRYNNAPTGAGIRLSHTGSGYVVLYGFDTTNPYTGSGASYRMASNTRYKYVYNNNSASLSTGGTVVDSTTFTVNDPTTREVAINTYSSSDTWSATTEGIYLYSFKAWNGQGELVMDLVPAVQRGTVPVVGFYDAATGGFRGPTGGTFAAGPEAVPTPDAPISIVCNNGVLELKQKPYLESNGPQCINTGYVLQETDSVEVDFQLMDLSRAGDKHIIGCQPISGGTNGLWVKTYNPANLWYVRFGSDTSANTPSTNDQLRGTFVIKKESFVVNGVEVLTPSYSGLNPNPLCLFARPSADGTLPGTGASVRIFEVRIKNGDGEIIKRYVPEKVNNVAGMREVISDTFLTNIGTGSFTYGTGVAYPIEITAEDAVETIEDTIGNTATAEMLLKVGDYQDVQSIIDGVVTRNVGIVILDGTENWSLGTVFSADNVAQRAVFPSTSMSTHFVGNVSSTSPNLFKNNSFKVGASGYRNRIYIKATQYADETEFKAFLAQQYANGTPVIVVYPLETPTTESVAGQTLQVQAGDNVLEITQASLDGLELEATYKSLVQLTIQEVEDANLNNNVEVTIS